MKMEKTEQQKEARTGAPDLLYHYTTQEGLLGIIKKQKWGSCLSTVRAIGCGCWFTNAAIYTLCFQHDSSLSGDMRPEEMAPYIGAAVLRQLPHFVVYFIATQATAIQRKMQILRLAALPQDDKSA